MPRVASSRTADSIDLEMRPAQAAVPPTAHPLRSLAVALIAMARQDLEHESGEDDIGGSSTEGLTRE